MRKLVAFLILPLALAACSKVSEPDNNFKPSEGVPEEPGPTSLVIKDDVVGTGKEAKTGDTVKVHYTGTLMNGKKFDSSHDHGDQPFEFKLGEGKVIKGWDEGVPGMKVGGKRKLVIPYDKAYGEHGSPPTIPGKAALKFDVELISIN
jgi:FKBP-type peptidyl-prolyl cis-trans isomerase FkpA